MATFWGKRIRAEVARKGVKVGSRISIHHFADSVRNLSGGRQYRTALWRLEVLLTPQEIERIKAQELKERLELTESIQRCGRRAKSRLLAALCGITLKVAVLIHGLLQFKTTFASPFLSLQERNGPSCWLRSETEAEN